MSRVVAAWRSPITGCGSSFGISTCMGVGDGRRFAGPRLWSCDAAGWPAKSWPHFALAIFCLDSRFSPTIFLRRVFLNKMNEKQVRKIHRRCCQVFVLKFASKSGMLAQVGGVWLLSEWDQWLKQVVCLSLSNGASGQPGSCSGFP